MRIKVRLSGVVAVGLCVLILLVSVLVPFGARPAARAAGGTVTWLVRTDPVVQPWERATVAAFQKLHPDITVQFIVSAGGAAYDQKLLTMVASGTPPSIFSHWGNNSWADMAYRGVAADLSPFIATSHFSLAGMDPTQLKRYSIGGHVYGIPFASGGSYLFYNADLLKAARIAPPTTNWNDKSWNWAALLKNAQALTKNPGDAAHGQWGLYPNIWPTNGYAWLFGGDIFPQSSYTTGVVNQVTATSPAVEQAVQWKQDLTQKYKIAPNPSQTSGMSSLSDPFLSGRIAMEPTGIWGFWVFAPAKFKWGAAALPTFKTNKDVIFTDPWIMAKNTTSSQAAWTFLQYLASPRYGDKTYVETTGVYPPWSQLVTPWAQMMAKRTTLTVEQLKQLGAGSMAHGQESINHLAINYGQFDDSISNVLQPVWTGSTTPKAALAQLQARLQSDIKKAGISAGGYTTHH